MSDYKTIDDLQIKTKTPNHLATTLEKQAAAGAKLPNTLAKHISHLQHLTRLAHQLLPSVLGDELALSCSVVCVQGHKVTLSLPSITAVNHVRYLQVVCLEALRQHVDFGQFFELGVILSTKKRTKPLPTQPSTKKPLSENTKHNIAQCTEDVITNPNLKHSLLKLINTINLAPEN